MAVVKYGTPVDYMTMVRLRQMARENGTYYTLLTTRATLVAALNA